MKDLCIIFIPGDIIVGRLSEHRVGKTIVLTYYFYNTRQHLTVEQIEKSAQAAFQEKPYFVNRDELELFLGGLNK